MTELSAASGNLLNSVSRQEVEDFLYEEAALLDERRLEAVRAARARALRRRWFSLTMTSSGCASA